MKKIKHIAAAMDFIEYSPHILEYAGAIAERVSARIIVVDAISRRLVSAAEQLSPPSV